MSIVNVTAQVDFELNDDESLALTKCVCGARFEPWTFIIDMYKNDPVACPMCDRKLFFTLDIAVFEVQE
jgi:hypothetical protein